MLWAIVVQGADTKAPVEWAVMRKQAQKQIFEMTAWKKKFKGRNYSEAKGVNTLEYASCAQFMNMLYNKVAEAVSQYGDWDPNDSNWMNFLWSDDLCNVFVVDLGNAIKIRGNREEWWQIRKPIYYNALAEEGSLPLLDVPDEPILRGYVIRNGG
ncbi:hypothetical protein FRB99_007884 [Tulasnella sp. 403]|nr:hypothetical protein FRB99_007884 [Tulasnella sp. 403]